MGVHVPTNEMKDSVSLCTVFSFETVTVLPFISNPLVESY